MHDVFLSYRRADSSTVTGRIFDHLTTSLGEKRVFKDVDSIALGMDFRLVIERAVGECMVMLAIMGDQWLDAKGQDGIRRLDDPDDFVRIELETALTRNIPVIPVLVGSQAMPSAEELPSQIRDLAFRNGLFVRPDPDFKNDLERLTSQIKTYLTPSDPPRRSVRSRVTRRSLLVGLVIAALGTAATLFVAVRPAEFEIAEEETGQRILRDFKLLYRSSDATDGLASLDGFGGRCKIPSNFVQLESVEAYGYDFSHAEGSRVFLRRDDNEFRKSITPDRDTYDLPTLTEFELAKSTIVNLDEFTLTIKNETPYFIDLMFLHHDPQKGAIFPDSWELIVPSIEPREERALGDFRRQPGYFLVFASSHGKKAQHLISANLYSRPNPTLEIVASADGFDGKLVW